MDRRYDRNDKNRFLTMYTQKEDVTCIVEYISLYQTEFELKFGKLEGPKPSNGSCLSITSVGHTIKVFLGLIMADRMTVVREKCAEARVQAGFLEMVSIDPRGTCIISNLTVCIIGFATVH